MNTIISKYRMMNLRQIRWRHRRNIQVSKFRKKIAHQIPKNSTVLISLKINCKSRRYMNKYSKKYINF